METITDIIQGLPSDLQDKAVAVLTKLKEQAKPRDLRAPTAPFICFNCGVERSIQYWSKNLLGKRICKFCSPYVDEDDVRYMIRFDGGER